MKDKALNIPETPEEKYYVIAYIDLLGTKELLANKSETVAFGDIYYPFLIAGRIMPNMRELKWDEIKIKIFSDNILIAYEVNNIEDIVKLITEFFLCICAYPVNHYINVISIVGGIHIILQ